jgi:hypothetical protein
MVIFLLLIFLSTPIPHPIQPPESIEEIDEEEEDLDIVIIDIPKQLE